MRRWVLLVMATAATAQADPDPPACSSLSMYIEPSLLFGASRSGVGGLQRDAIGLLARRCDGTHDGLNLRLGATYHYQFGNIGLNPNQEASGGGEAELSWPLEDDNRVGARIGVEAYQDMLSTAGVRWRRGHLSFGGDVFASAYHDDHNRIVWNGGVMAGAGGDFNFHFGRNTALVVAAIALGLLTVGFIGGLASG